MTGDDGVFGVASLLDCLLEEFASPLLHSA